MDRDQRSPANPWPVRDMTGRGENGYHHAQSLGRPMDLVT